MKEVFIVVAETYPEDHEILGVFNSEEAANRYLDAERGSRSDCEIQRWPVTE